MNRTEVVERVVNASPATIFDVIADPARHADFDGSDTVKGIVEGQRICEVGERFSMHMRIGIPYQATSTVTEFEEGRLVAWRPWLIVGGVTLLGGQIWRYELEPAPGGTLVRETYVWGTARTPGVLKLLGFPDRTREAMTGTLERLAKLVESS